MHRSIAVGMGGAGSGQALAWATEEAERTGSRLILLHVCVPGSALDGISGDPTPAQVELFNPGLARALTSTRARLGGRRATLKIRSGEPADRLAAASSGVGLLVIGAGEGGRTVRRILRHTFCPVVVARPAPADSAAPFAGRVVAAVDESVAGHIALEFAFSYAAEHHFPLAAVNVAATDQAASAARDLLSAELEPWVRKFPDVPAEIVARRGSVPDELIRVGGGVRLLVVGDKRRGVIGRARTGDVPAMVASEATCPVAVVPVQRREGVQL